MQEYLNQLSENLIYVKQELVDNVLYVYCNYKNTTQFKVHTYKVRKVNDINYGNYKVVLLIKVFQYYLDRKNSNRVISIQPDFIDGRSSRTRRLTEYILNASKESSAIGLERTLKNVTNISDSTILRMVKKNDSN